MHPFRLSAVGRLQPNIQCDIAEEYEGEESTGQCKPQARFVEAKPEKSYAGMNSITNRIPLMCLFRAGENALRGEQTRVSSQFECGLDRLLRYRILGCKPFYRASRVKSQNPDNQRVPLDFALEGGTCSQKPRTSSSCRQDEVNQAMFWSCRCRNGEDCRGYLRYSFFDPSISTIGCSLPGDDRIDSTFSIMSMHGTSKCPSIAVRLDKSHCFHRERRNFGQLSTVNHAIARFGILQPSDPIARIRMRRTRSSDWHNRTGLRGCR